MNMFQWMFQLLGSNIKHAQPFMDQFVLTPTESTPYLNYNIELSLTFSMQPADIKLPNILIYRAVKMHHVRWCSCKVYINITKEQFLWKFYNVLTINLLGKFNPGIYFIGLGATAQQCIYWKLKSYRFFNVFLGWFKRVSMSFNEADTNLSTVSEILADVLMMLPSPFAKGIAIPLSTFSKPLVVL